MMSSLLAVCWGAEEPRVMATPSAAQTAAAASTPGGQPEAEAHALTPGVPLRRRRLVMVDSLQKTDMHGWSHEPERPAGEPRESFPTKEDTVAEGEPQRLSEGPLPPAEQPLPI
jgi:hypothetical protein